MSDLDIAQRKLKGVMSKLPLQNARISEIVKVTFEDKNGKLFIVHDARVWKIDFAGNLAYQIRGAIPDLVEYFAAPEITVIPEEKKDGE